MRYFFSILAVSLLVGCSTPSEEVHTSIDGDRGPPGSIHNMPRGCYIMEEKKTGGYDCFGCSNENCKDEDLNLWDYTDQDAANSMGYFCEETPQGCFISQ